MTKTTRWYSIVIDAFLFLSIERNLVLGFARNEIIKCIEAEKEALLSFKHGLLDEHNTLSSWGPYNDCCNWRGVQCNHNTGHVISLDLRDSQLEGKIDSSLGNLSHLIYLNLSHNSFSGFLPNVIMFPSLKELDLSHNMFTGIIPQSLGRLSSLEYLNLGENLLEGEVYESHFLKLTKLKHLYLSGNSLILHFKPNWIPPFRLASISLSSCKLGPLFPKWLQTQNFSRLNLSFTEISDTIPYWFWSNLSPNIALIDLSGNKIKGEIPNLPIKLKKMPDIYLSSNNLSGEIPSFLQHARTLDLSKNKFSSVTFLCEITKNSSLLILGLSHNQFSGQIPNCWDHLPDLVFLSLANNNFSGDIPRSMGNLSQLLSLNLRKNRLSGKFPLWLKFPELRFFNAMENELRGSIPTSIGSNLPNLVYLNLKLNQICGHLPQSFCSLKNLRVLDVSSNNIKGKLPTCITNFKALTQTSNSSDIYDWNFSLPVQPEVVFPLVLLETFEGMTIVWKGRQQFIKGKVFLLQKSIDFSCNQLGGQIPDEITELVGLINLNLSRNALQGLIPEKIGQLQLLDSLDLSRNRLFGVIPASFSQMSQLSTVKLSYNNLSGRIPLGTQLQSFEASSYEGNSYLCGAPLKKCLGEEIQDPNINSATLEENENEDGFTSQEFFVSMFVGFVVGFWGIFGSLIVNRKWRHMYFKFVGDIIEKITQLAS